MAHSDKIIPFRQVKGRKKSEFRLMTEISIYICRDGDRYTCDCTSTNDSDTIENIIHILKKILIRMSRKVGKIKIRKRDQYEVAISLLYYENVNNKYDWKYICLNKNIQQETLTEYLFTFISIYEYQKTHHK